MPATLIRLLMLGLLGILSGCAMAGPTDERLWALESEMELLRTQETRLAIVEDRLYGLSRELDGVRSAMIASGVVTFPAPVPPANTVPQAPAYAENHAGNPTGAPVGSQAASGATLPPPAHSAEPRPAEPSAGHDQVAPQPESSGTAAQTPAPAPAPVPTPTPTPAPTPVPAEQTAQSAQSGQNAAVSTPSVSPAPSPAPAATGEQGQYKKALSTLEAGRAQEALGLFNDFLRAHPGSKLAPNALYWRGECSYSLGRYADAIISFKDVVTRYPKNPKAAAAMLKAGYAYERLGDLDNARLYLDVLVQDYPGSDPARLARARLATL